MSAISACFSSVYRNFTNISKWIISASDQLHTAALELKMQCIHVNFIHMEQVNRWCVGYIQKHYLSLSIHSALIHSLVWWLDWDLTPAIGLLRKATAAVGLQSEYEPLHSCCTADNKASSLNKSRHLCSPGVLFISRRHRQANHHGLS